KKARWATVIVVVLLVAAAAAWPTSRAWALNLVGVRASADVTVLDGITKLPLRDVDVSIGGSQGRTNSQGEVSLGLVKLGTQQLRVRKRAFAVSYTSEHIGLGVNHLGTVNLRPAGDRYQLRAIDYVSGKPVAAAMAVAGDAEAIADKQGIITLTISGVNAGDNVSFKAYVSADGYRTQPVNLTNAQSGVTTVQLVTTRPDVYFSNQSGKYDLYKSDIDGQNKKLLVAGTGSETSSLSLLVHPSGAEAAFVDTRDGTHDSDGYLEQSLSLVNVSTGALTTIDHSDRIQLVDWVGDRIVYIKTKAGASAANPSRYQMLSYDYRINQRLTLDHANAFNDVVSTDGSIYYATSNQYDGGVSQFVSIHADATNRQVLLNTEVWNILRKDYDDFYLSSGNANYAYKLGDAKPTATNETDNNPSRLYVDSPDGKHSLWVDQRDGKGVLLSYDLATQKDTVIAELPGITYPVRWLSNDTIIYRVKTYNETADYVIGLSSNTSKKITDVTDASGKSLWYFY
ncbi:MAG TPA: hypothetical protein VFH39_03905, partial [Candidatus Saccharimonadales bacterium]|nr:hypothetical protein [Candidatus Saccharimonadales bacterium]